MYILDITTEFQNIKITIFNMILVALSRNKLRSAFPKIIVMLQEVKSSYLFTMLINMSIVYSFTICSKRNRYRVQSATILFIFNVFVFSCTQNRLTSSMSPCENEIKKK